jgi:hypothetical protein
MYVSNESKSATGAADLTASLAEEKHFVGANCRRSWVFPAGEGNLAAPGIIILAPQAHCRFLP